MGYDGYLYHITGEAEAACIMRDGLKPLIGERAKLAGEQSPAIYLSDERNLPTWKGILYRPVVLQVDVRGITGLTCRLYCFYNEYCTDKPIGPERIKRVFDTGSDNGNMKELCMQYIDIISEVVTIIVRYYSDRLWMYDMDYVKSILGTLVYSLRGLDYSVCTEEEIVERIKRAGDDGESTFLDRYLFDSYDCKDRLYEMLVKYPKDEIAELRTELYEFIKTTFKPYLEIDTGGISV